MQRVAIARALVNNPDILLADEPTGALDTETSVQIMELLKEISKDRLIIMVTHNPELAMKYSTRIVRLLDGTIVDLSLIHICFAIVLARGANAECTRAANEVLNGHITIAALYFHVYDSTVDKGGTIIGDHVFY